MNDVSKDPRWLGVPMTSIVTDEMRAEYVAANALGWFNDVDTGVWYDEREDETLEPGLVYDQWEFIGPVIEAMRERDLHFYSWPTLDKGHGVFFGPLGMSDQRIEAHKSWGCMKHKDLRIATLRACYEALKGESE